MIKFKNWMDEVLDLEVHVMKYLEGNQLAVILVDPIDEEDYSVVTRNIPEAHGFLKPNQSLAEMIVERLAADYLKNPDCKLTNDEEPLSPEVFKATVVKAISQCFESLQLCYWE